MRSIAFLFAICCLLNNPVNKYPVIPQGAVKGNFSGKQGYTWLVIPQLSKDGESCLNGDCIAYLKFSDPAIKPIKIAGCIGGQPTNLGDLDNDGKDEIGLLPEWFTSCWRGYQVYTIKNGVGEYAVKPFMTHCNQWENHVKPIEKDPRKKGYVIISYSEIVKDSIVVKTKSVMIK